ncbi:MAG: hypothetical protein ABIE84_03440 [bacterium]
MASHYYSVQVQKGTGRHMLLPRETKIRVASEMVRTSLNTLIAINIIANDLDLAKLATYLMASVMTDSISAGRIPSYIFPSSTTAATSIRAFSAVCRAKRFSGRSFNMDEYLVSEPNSDPMLLPSDHPLSLQKQMEETGLFKVPDWAPYFPAIADVGTGHFERRIEAWGGIDMVVLPYGVNGHVGFYEPRDHQSTDAARVETVSLQSVVEQTRERNARLMGANMDEIPGYAVTVGPGTIFGVPGLLSPPRHVLLMATQKEKAGITKRALTERVSAECPLSFVQEYIANGGMLTVLLTEEAASSF